MVEEKIKGNTYKLPCSLTPFQKEMYVHLIDWKWKNITREPGINNYKGRKIKYDAFLPESVIPQYPVIYPPVFGDLIAHQTRPGFNFRMHLYFNHMASSQAANINLFLPVLLNKNANDILKKLKPDFKRLNSGDLYKGFRIEYWDHPYGDLNDKNKRTGTDADLAISYFNENEEPCLWLIEHKLTEKEFTQCGGYRSKGKKPRHDCSRSFSGILKDKNTCYYHDVCKYRYWDITEDNLAFYANQNKYTSCPFKGGMNQLWRNQLLGMAIEKRGLYKHVYFSVVRHHRNKALDKTLAEYHRLVNDNPKFSAFDSSVVINIASSIPDPELQTWVEWYRGLYGV
jgi:hypothetical protein